jgi:hypothetical protein
MENPITYHTYRAQLTFGLKPSKTGVNVANLFNEWFLATSKSLENFSLLPFEEGEKGQQISSAEQIPVDSTTFYKDYYFNHRILNHGNLTGMVCFQSSTSWSKIKSYNSTYFNWLRTNNAFLNQTKFKTSTLVACGFLVGAHPGYLRRDEAEKELRASLQLPQDGADSDEEDIPFQLSSRTTTVAIQEGGKERYAFQAIVVETATNHATKLRERFYKLDNPMVAQTSYPYTGKYQFVPFLKTKEWTISKILQLAKIHVNIVHDLKPIFLANIQDIHNEINQDGESMLQGFYGMQYTIPATEGHPPTKSPLLHSIHNTGNPTTKVALVPSNHFDEALNQLSAIHDILATNIASTYHSKVFVPKARAGITGQQIDSISSCNYSNYASQLLESFNPQDGETQAAPVQKRARQIPLSYAAAITTPTEEATSSPSKLTTTTTMSSLTSTDIDLLYEKMKHHISSDYGDSPAIKIEDLEIQVKNSSQEIKNITNQLEDTVKTMSLAMQQQNTRVDNLALSIDKQNVIILGMQKDFQETMKHFSEQIQALYEKPITDQTLTPTSTTSMKGRLGDTQP